MNKITISIDEITKNSNLDLTEILPEYLDDFSPDDAKDLAIARIKQEYEYWANNRTVINKQTDELLSKILSGHLLTKGEILSLFYAEEKNDEYNRFFEIEEKVKKTGTISEEDFDFIISKMGWEEDLSSIIKKEFQNKGKISK